MGNKQFLFFELRDRKSKKYILPMLRGGSRAAATSKMGRFAITANGFQSLTIIITKRSILDVAAVLNPPLLVRVTKKYKFHKTTHGGFHKY